MGLRVESNDHCRSQHLAVAFESDLGGRHIGRRRPVTVGLVPEPTPPPCRQGCPTSHPGYEEALKPT